MRNDADADTRPRHEPPDIRRAGDRALLVDVGSLTAAMSWHGALTAAPLTGQVEVVAAARTVLARFDADTAAEAAVASLSSLTPDGAGARSPCEHVLDVVYDGEDLAEAARLLGLSPDGLVDAHTGTLWQAAFGGFAPGFAYCVPADGGSPWDVPRLSEPRTAVPPGSVGLAGMFSAVYPRRSPGGWRLIGRTDAQLWNAEAEPPALLSPGDHVRYRAVRSTARASDPSPVQASDPSAASDRSTARASDPSATQASDPSAAPSSTPASDDAAIGAEPATSGEGPRSDGHCASAAPIDEAPVTERSVFRVDDPGLLTLVEDAGRPGRGDLGVSPSGFADRASARAANITVGNPPDAPVLEVMGTARLTCLSDVAVAVAGAAGGETVTPQLLRAGEALTLEPALGLARTYVAVRGGVAAAAEVGSASADVLSGLGPDPLFAGAQVAAAVRGPSASAGHGTDNPAWARRLRDDSGEAVVLRVVPGPRDDWFAPGELARFTSILWTVEAQSNRVGTRLTPAEDEEPLRRAREGELASEGTVTGTVQVPASGLPVVFGPDRPVTGGYPAIATVLDEDLDALAQLPPGARVRFQVADA